MKNITLRDSLEVIVVLAVTLLFSLVVGLLGAFPTKFQIAFMLGLIMMVMFITIPQKRTLCLFLWALVQPLSIEKIVYTSKPVWNGLRGTEIVVNAGDIIVLGLLAILVAQRMIKHRPVFEISKMAWCYIGLVMWATVSFSVHTAIYQDNFNSDFIFGVMHLVKMFLFIVVITSAIQTRADLIWVLIALLASLLLQSVLVSASFATGNVYNFGILLGQEAQLQEYSGSDGAIKRATGTLGVANQQAAYHAMHTFLLFGLFALRGKVIKHLSVLVILFSMGALLLTFARGAWFSVFVGAVVMIAVFYKRHDIKPKAWLIGAMSLLVLMTVLAALSGPILDRLTKGDDGATDSRIRMAQLAKDLFVKYPVLGVGVYEYVESGLKLYPPGYNDTEWVALGDKPIVPPLGRVELAVNIPKQGEPLIVPLPVHNKYLLVASELGLVGLSLWFALLYYFYKDALRCGQSNDKLIRFLGASGYAVLIAASLYMMLDLFNDDKSVQNILFPMLVISAAAKLARQERNTQTPQRPQ